MRNKYQVKLRERALRMSVEIKDQHPSDRTTTGADSTNTPSIPPKIIHRRYLLPSSPQLPPKRIEVVTVRDPDGPLDVRVFVDGVEHSFSEYTVDAGAGWSWDDWKVARDSNLSAASDTARASLLDAYTDPRVAGMFSVDNPWAGSTVRSKYSNTHAPRPSPGNSCASHSRTETESL